MISEEEFNNLLSKIDAVYQKLEQTATGQNVQSDGLLTREETAEFLKISLPTLGELTKCGTIPAYRLGGRVLYKKEEVLASLEVVKSLKYRRAS